MKTVVITGASRGIGRAVALRFLKEGWQVVGIYRQNEDAADAMRGQGITMYQADLSDANQAFAACAKITAAFGAVDVLVNNAGSADQRLFTQLCESDYRKIMGDNLDSAFFCCQAFSKGMIARQSGAIVNVSSMWGQVGASCEVVYSAAKAGILGLTKALAKELGPSGITVNAVCPGVIQTDMTASLGEETLNALAEETPLGRNGTPDEVADAVYFLAQNPFTTGQTLGVNGGFVIV